MNNQNIEAVQNQDSKMSAGDWAAAIALTTGALFVIGAILACIFIPPPTFTTNRDYYTQKGLLGQRPLHKLNAPGGVSGYITGGFSHGSGSIKGSIDPGVTFFWEASGSEVYLTTIPQNKIKFVMDETRDIPTVEFIFNKNWYGTSYQEVNASLSDPDQPRHHNLNLEVMNNWRLDSVLIRISAQSMAKEVYMEKSVTVQ